MSFSIEEGFTSVDNRFIDFFMPKAPHMFSVIYIYAYRLCAEGKNVTNAEIADKLELFESDVIKAWRYWSEKGIITLCEEPFSLVFKKIVSQDKPETKEKPLLSYTPSNEKPSYTPQEIEFYREKSESVRKMFDKAGEYYGRLLSQSDMAFLFGLYDWLRMTPDLIEILLAYCSEKNNMAARYIESIAIDWVKKGITTPEQANKYLLQKTRGYKEILGSMGIYGRNPVPDEEDYIYKWLNKYNLPMEVVKRGCKKSLTYTGNAKFEYIDRIMSEWRKKNIDTIEKVEKDEKDFAQNKEARKKENAKKEKAHSGNRKNRFVNYAQREWDFDKIKQLENTYIDESLKK